MAYSTDENLIVYYNGSNWMKITGVTTLWFLIFNIHLNVIIRIIKTFTFYS
jgi:hypothetical protein